MLSETSALFSYVCYFVCFFRSISSVWLCTQETTPSSYGWICVMEALADRRVGQEDGPSFFHCSLVRHCLAMATSSFKHTSRQVVPLGFPFSLV